MVLQTIALPTELSVEKSMFGKVGGSMPRATLFHRRLDLSASDPAPSLHLSVDLDEL